MPLCCIGGVCIPYTAIVPLLVLGLQWIVQKLFALGIVPQNVQDKILALLQHRSSSSNNKSSTSTSASKQGGGGGSGVDERKRRKSSVKASESCCSTTTRMSSASSSSCCGDSSSSHENQANTSNHNDNNKAATTTTTTARTTKTGVVQLIESEDDWESFIRPSVTVGDNGGLVVVVVKMTATWCQPCKAIQPFYEQLAASTFVDIPCAIMDVDELDEVAAQYRVAALPTFLALQNNVVVHRYSGSGEHQLQNFFEKIKEYQQS